MYICLSGPIYMLPHSLILGLWTVWLHLCVETKNGSSRSESSKEVELWCDDCLIYQHNMDCIKTEPDPDDEVYSASCDEIQLIDVKQEEQPLSIRYPPAKDANDVSCQCICC